MANSQTSDAYGKPGFRSEVSKSATLLYMSMRETRDFLEFSTWQRYALVPVQLTQHHTQSRLYSWTRSAVPYPCSRLIAWIHTSDVNSDRQDSKGCKMCAYYSVLPVLCWMIQPCEHVSRCILSNFLSARIIECQSGQFFSSKTLQPHTADDCKTAVFMEFLCVCLRSGQHFSTVLTVLTLPFGECGQTSASWNPASHIQKNYFQNFKTAWLLKLSRWVTTWVRHALLDALDLIHLPSAGICQEV